MFCEFLVNDVDQEVPTMHRHLHIPDISERERLAEKAAAARARRTAVRRITHSCGHQQGHVIEANGYARDRYRTLASQPCGACGGDFGGEE